MPCVRKPSNLRLSTGLPVFLVYPPRELCAELPMYQPKSRPQTPVPKSEKSKNSSIRSPSRQASPNLFKFTHLVKVIRQSKFQPEAKQQPLGQLGRAQRSPQLDRTGVYPPICMRAMSGRLCSGPDRASGHCFGRKPDVLSSTWTKFWIFTEQSGQGMSMPSKGLSLSQWNSLYANRIAASLTSTLKTWGSSTMAGKPSAVEADGNTQLGVGGGGKVRSRLMRLRSWGLKVKRLSPSHDFSLNPRKRANVRPPERPFCLRSKSSNATYVK